MLGSPPKSSEAASQHDALASSGFLKHRVCCLGPTSLGPSSFASCNTPRPIPFAYHEIHVPTWSFRYILGLREGALQSEAARDHASRLWAHLLSTKATGMTVQHHPHVVLLTLQHLVHAFLASHLHCASLGSRCPILISMLSTVWCASCPIRDN